MKKRIKNIVNITSGRRFAISDIHGCNYSFNAIIETINISHADQLFILGDFINRGKRSKDVLNTIIDLKKDNYQIYPIRGNHEDFLISYIEDAPYNKLLEYLGRSGLLGIVDNYGKIKRKYLKLFESLPYYIESGNELLVHAGFNFETDPFKNTKAMITIREMKINDTLLNGKRIIHGHTPTVLPKIIKTIENKSKNINIDNGVMLTTESGKGNIVCLNLDSNEIIIQKNID